MGVILAQGPLLMVFSDVDCLSDESIADPPKASSAQPRKRCRKRRKEVVLQDLTDDEVRKQLSSPCPCNKACLEQFKHEPMFSKFKAYITEWSNLAKLDKDNIVTSIGFQTNFCFLRNHFNQFFMCSANQICVCRQGICPDEANDIHC